MSIVFSPEQVRLVRQGRMSAILVSRSERVAAGDVRSMRRRLPADPEIGQRARVEIVAIPAPDGARVPVRFTVTEVLDEVIVRELGLLIARTCGYRTTIELQAAWQAGHPGVELAQLVKFTAGDLRDTPRLLAPTGSGRDYTTAPARAMRAEPESVSATELERMARAAAQRFAAHRAQLAREVADEKISRRLAKIERATGAAPRLSIRMAALERHLAQLKDLLD